MVRQAINAKECTSSGTCRAGKEGGFSHSPADLWGHWKIASSHPGSAVSRSLIDLTQPKFGNSKLTNNWKNSRSKKKKKARKKKNLVSLFYYLFWYQFQWCMFMLNVSLSHTAQDVLFTENHLCFGKSCNALICFAFCCMLSLCLFCACISCLWSLYMLKIQYKHLVK